MTSPDPEIAAQRLLTALQQACHVFVAQAPDGVLHLVFNVLASDWITGCRMKVGEWPASRFKFGRPTCLGCVVGPDQSALGRWEPADVVTLRPRRQGPHVYTSVFLGPENGTRVKIGAFTTSDAEWRTFCAIVVLGCTALQLRCVLEEMSE